MIQKSQRHGAKLMYKSEPFKVNGKDFKYFINASI